MGHPEFADAKRLWLLDPSVTYLNHGSFGACPLAVLYAQQAWRARMEFQPVHFIVRDGERMLEAARTELGRFLGADPADLAFVHNATSGVNTVVRSLEFEPGDELLTINHAYNACRNVLEYVAGRSRARVVVAPVPFPIDSPDRVVEAVLAAVTPRTRLAMLDHVTSPTGLVLPIERLVQELAERGIDTLVDGAHAPGMLPLDLNRLGAAYYTGNGHKWLCAPKGVAFLWVRRDRQERIRPLVISHGANALRSDCSRFRIEFDYLGTDDISGYLAAAEAVRYVGSLLPGGWPALMERNRAQVLRGRAILAEAMGVSPPCPESMIGSIATLPLPDGSTRPPQSAFDTDPLQDALLRRHRIEVPIFTWPGAPRRWIRVSAQLYNVDADYERLAAALREELAAPRT